MDPLILVGIASVISSGLTIAIGAISPALGEGRAVAQGLHAIAQQPDESGLISRTLFVGLAMIESHSDLLLRSLHDSYFRQSLLGLHADPCRTERITGRRPYWLHINPDSRSDHYNGIDWLCVGRRQIGRPGLGCPGSATGCLYLNHQNVVCGSGHDGISRNLRLCGIDGPHFHESVLDQRHFTGWRINGAD